jgi:hypothetical protein
LIAEFQIFEAVFVIQEDIYAPIATLGDMVRKPFGNNSSSPWHAAIVREEEQECQEKVSVPFFYGL